MYESSFDFQATEEVVQDVAEKAKEILRASATLTILAALVGTNSFDSAPAVCRTAIRIADEMFRQLENTNEPDDESLGNE